MWTCSHTSPSPTARSAAPPCGCPAVSSLPLSRLLPWPAAVFTLVPTLQTKQALRPWSASNHSTSGIVDSRNPLPLALQACPPSSTPVCLICSGLSPLQALLAPAQRGPCPPQLIPPTLRLSLPSVPSDTGLLPQAVLFRFRQGHVSLTSGLLSSPLSPSASILQARRPEGPSTSTHDPIWPRLGPCPMNELFFPTTMAWLHPHSKLNSFPFSKRLPLP